MAKWVLRRVGFCALLGMTGLLVLTTTDTLITSISGAERVALPPFQRVKATKQENIFNAFSKEKDHTPVSVSDPQHEFIPQNTDMLKTLPNVCIVQKPNAKRIKIGNGKFVTEKDIIVYNSPEDKEVVLKVTSGYPSAASWPIKFRKKGIPPDFNVVTYPAYFIIATHPGNLYHFIKISVKGLYGAMKLTNRLNSTVPNQVLMRNPLVGPDRNSNRTRYADIIKALSVRDDQNVYHAMPSGTCYPYGVFGWKPTDLREVGTFIARQLDHIYPPKCPKGIVLTFIRRTTRKIQNMPELLNALINAGFGSTRVVAMEKLSFEEQWKAIRCTDILIGVQGSALQWCMFLNQNSGLLELAHENWSFFYSKICRGFLQTEQLKAKETIVDWKLISEMYFSGEEMTEARKEEVLSRESAHKYGDIWGGTGFKWADSRYDPKAFVDKVISLGKRIRH